MPDLARLMPKDRQALELFVRRLQAEFGTDIADVRLFGSQARGEADGDSDVDVLVLVNRPEYALKHAILWVAAEISLAHEVLLSPRVIPSTAWERMAQADTLFYRTVRAEGVPLLSAPAA